MKYQEQLQQPEWAEKRKEILQLRGYVCEECGDNTQPLHIHHKSYDLSKMAWEYSDDNFSCLCEHHHQLKHLPDCCDIPIYKLVYDIDARAKVLLYFEADFCPFCGKRRS